MVLCCCVGHVVSIIFIDCFNEPYNLEPISRALLVWSNLHTEIIVRLMSDSLCTHLQCDVSGSHTINISRSANRRFFVHIDNRQVRRRRAWTILIMITHQI